MGKERREGRVQHGVGDGNRDLGEGQGRSWELGPRCGGDEPEEPARGGSRA